MKEEIVPAAFIISILLLVAMSGTLSGSELFQIEVKGYVETVKQFDNPVTLFEVPNDVKGEFGVGFFNEELEPKVDFQVGESVSIILMVNWFHGGNFPVIANCTTISLSNETGDIILSEVTGQIGGAWTSGTCGGQGEVVRWIPDLEGNYSASVEFEELIYEVAEDWRNIIPFRVHKPGSFIGKITEDDETTAISYALVEALIDDVVKATAITDYEGNYNLALEKAGVYDIRVSAPGYVSSIRRGINTELESKRLNFSLTPATLSPNFNILWRTNAGNSRNVAIDSNGNIILVSRSEEGSTVVSKFDTAGNLLWNTTSSFSTAWWAPIGLAVDSSDNILLLITPNLMYWYNMYVVKLDPYGNTIWIESFDSGENDQSTSIAVDSFDNFIIIGSVHGNLTSTLVKYNSNRSLIWSKTLPIYFETGEILVDNDNNIILGGSTISDSTGEDYYIAKLDFRGNLLWEKTFNSENWQSDYGYGVSLDSNENIIVFGDKFTVKLGPNGSEIWLKYFSGKDLVIDQENNIFTLRESSVEMFTPNGLFLGSMKLEEDLSVLAIDQNCTIIVGGAKNVMKINLDGNSTAQLDNSVPQTKTPTNSDLNTTLITTFAFINLEPSVTEVDQAVIVDMSIEPSPTSGEVFQGITLTITNPNGQVYVTGPYLTDSNGSQHMFFTPAQTGNYTFQLDFPGQLFKSKEVEYVASESQIATLTVNSKPAALSNPEPDGSTQQSPVSHPEPSQETLTTPDDQQAHATPPVLVFASMGSIIALSTVTPIYFKKRKH
jgi:hypothetical protein